MKGEILNKWLIAIGRESYRCAKLCSDHIASDPGGFEPAPYAF